MGQITKLFYRFEISTQERDFRESITNRILEEPREDFLNLDKGSYVDDLVKDFEREPLVLQEGEIVVAEQFEKECRNPETHLFYRQSFVKFAIPYRGERELFFVKPTTSLTVFLDGEVPNGRNELLLTLEAQGDGDKLKAELDRQVQIIKRFIEFQRSDVDRWNQELRPFVDREFENRRLKLIEDLKTIDTLGIPLRKRSGLTGKYAISLKSKPITISKRGGNAASVKSSPVVDEATYGEILKALSNMALVMERSPSAFVDMDEELLRMHFLVQLNGTFEGNATGETFNFRGKTDMLLKHEGKILFVAECKFWKGPRSFNDAIDQLLDYLTWRDARTALLVFVRKTAITTVLAEIPISLSQHPQFKRMEPSDVESEFRARMTSKRDANISLDLVVQVYDVPT